MIDDVSVTSTRKAVLSVEGEEGFSGGGLVAIVIVAMSLIVGGGMVTLSEECAAIIL